MSFSKYGRVIWLLFAITFGSIFFILLNPVQALEIIVEPMDIEIARQDTLRLDIYANNAAALISMGVKVSFDPNALNIVSATKNENITNGFILDKDGDPLTTADQYKNPPVEVDNAHGSVIMLGGRLIGTFTTGLSGKVLLGSIVFRGMQAGSSNIAIDLAKYHPAHPTKIFDNFVNIDGSVDEPTNLGNLAVITVTSTCTDMDGDGYGDPGDPSCPNGAEGDCNDNDSGVNPDAVEVCNGVDDNCNGIVDDTCSQDLDGDRILDDGDNSGMVGDNPCTGGEIKDCDDNCPGVSNPDQEDLDRDGVGDACDSCPDTPAGTIVDASGCPVGACIFPDDNCFEGTLQECTDAGGTYRGDNTVCISLSDGLVAYYPYNGDASDASGNENHGTVEGAVLAADACGTADSAYAFDGIDDGIIIPADDSLSIAGFQGGYTIAAWIKPTGLPTATDYYDVIASFNAAFSLRLVDDDSGLACFLEATHSNPDGSTSGFPFNLQPVSLGSWHHVAVTWDGNTNDWVLFVDGNPSDFSNIKTKGPPTLYPVAPENGAIGRDNWHDRWYFEGSIDEVRIYNRALSAEEIGELAGICIIKVTVPSLMGLSHSEAEMAITNTGLIAGSASFEYSTDVPEGKVISQNPAAGTEATSGTGVDLIISLGPEITETFPKDCREILIRGDSVGDGSYIIDPDGAGGQDPIDVECLMSLSDGGWTKLTDMVSQTAINTDSTIVREYLYVKDGKWYRTPASNLVWDWYSPKVLTGTYYYTGGSFYCASSSEVTRYYGVSCSNGPGNQWKALIYYTTGKNPSDAKVQLCQDRPGIFGYACQTGVTVYIRSEGPVQGFVPDVVGLSQGAAEAAITSAGFLVGSIIHQESSTFPSGDVISQDPPAGTQADVGSSVDLVVSSGPPFVSVPDVIGLEVESARESITALGLIVGEITEQYSDTAQAGIILNQDPGAGTDVAKGSAVDLIVSLGPDPESGLLAYWTFDNCNVTDTTGNGYNGTMFGGPLCVDGVSGKALDIDSTNDYVRLGKTLNPNKMKALSFWIYSRGVDGINEFGTIIAKYNWHGYRSFVITSFDQPYNAIGVKLYSDGVSYNGDSVSSYYPDPDSLNPNRFTVINNRELELNRWNHVVINVTESEIEIWINGEITNRVNRAYQQYFNSSEPTYIGNTFYIGGDFVYNYRLNGTLDQFRIYSRSLSPSEIGTLAGIGDHRPALASIDDQEMAENSTLGLSVSASDPDGDPINLSVMGLPDFGLFSDNGNGKGFMEFSPGPGDAGTYAVTIIASDGVLSGTETFRITVTGINHAPVLAFIDDQTLYAGDILTVNLSATDPDGDAVAFSAPGLPAFAELTDNNNGTAALTLTPTAGQAGSYEITVTVTDTGDPPLSGSETFLVQVHTISLDVSPGTMDFGEVTIGTTGYQSFTIASTGTAALQVAGIQSSTGVFSIFPPTGFTIEPGGPVRNVSVGFTPTAEGEVAGEINIISNAGDPVTITVTGRGIPAEGPGDILTPDSLEFGSVAEGTTAEQMLTITNTGSGPLTVTSAETSNSIFEAAAIPGEGLPFIVKPGASRNLTVRFTPPAGSAGTDLTGSLTIASDDPDETTRSIALSGNAIKGIVPPDETSPVLGARIYIDPDVFDMISAATCPAVSGMVQFGPDAKGTDGFYVRLTDQAGVSVTSPPLQSIDGPGTAAFGGMDACDLADGIIEVEVGYERNGTELPVVSGTPAVKYTGLLEPPVLYPVPPMVYADTLQVCGTSRSGTTVRIEGGASIVSASLDAGTTGFCLDVPLRTNTQNTLIASAIDDLAPPPKPVAYAQPVQVVQLDLSEIVIVNVYSRPLRQAEIEDLVNRGIIDLDDPGNFNVSMFTVVFTIGSFPVPITITQPVVVSHIPGSVSYGVGGGWFSGFGGGTGELGGSMKNAAQIVVITDKNGHTIPGVIIIDGRIKTLKEFFQVTIALWNISGGFTLSDMTASVRLPAGLTPMAAGPGSDIPDVNLEGAVDTVFIGEIGPGETGTGQFIIRGDAIGIYDINVDFEGFVTSELLPEPVPVSGSAGTTVQVLGPPELDVLVRFLTNPDGPDVTFGDIFDLIVEITNVSDRPALYASLELFAGGDVELLGIDGNPVAESNEIRSFGHIQPGQRVTAAFRLRSLSEGEIIACQAIAAENITLSIDIGPGGVPCNIVNMYPPNFEPLPADAAPVVIGVNPANGQTNIPITTSVFAVLTPQSACIVADTWKNVVVDYIDPLDHSKGLQVISADMVKAGTFYLEELDASGHPVRHIPADLTVVDPPAGGTTIAVLRLGLDSPHPNSQFFLAPNRAYRATLVGGADGVCSAASGTTMANSYTWIFSTGESAISPFGACILPNGSCKKSSLEGCLGAGGTYQGDDSGCPPAGACIMPDGSCSTATDEACTDAGGIYQGDDSGCPPAGACCLPNGSCSDGTEAYCQTIGGFYQGDYTDCAFVTCLRDSDGDGVMDDVDQCPDTPAGAEVDADGCSAGQRDSDGDGVMDDVDQCPDTPEGAEVDANGCPIGGCLLPNGSCVLATEQECLNAGDTPGEYLGDGTECAVTGACISPDGCCRETREQACTDTGGTYQGYGTQCPQVLVEVPDVTGILEAEAQSTLSALCLAVETECVITETAVPAGEVVSQVPPEGSLVSQGDLILLGVSSGLSAATAAVEGSSSGIFVNPKGPSGMAAIGVGTENFTWGVPLSASTASSSLSFAASDFATATEEEFSLGTLTFFNGTITPQSDADSVELRMDIAFSTPEGIVQGFVYNLELIDTPNIIGTSQEAQADIVRLHSLYSRSVFTVDGVAYTVKLTFGNLVSDTGGFTERSRFFVFEGQSASAELVAKITACSDLPPTGGCQMSDGSCIQTTEQDCMNVSDGSGEYLGDGALCQAMGACILPDGCCREWKEQDCSDAGGFYQGDDTQCEEDPIEVPDVVGMAETDAQAAIEALCLKVETECVVSEMSLPAGEVVSQDPAGGGLVAEGDVVLLGVSSGLPFTSGMVEGASDGVFVNPAGPSGMLAVGVGTNDFAWGDSTPFMTGPSRLIFEGATFSAATEEEFPMGILTFYNGTIEALSDVDTVDLMVTVDLSTPDGIAQGFVYSLELIDTPNISGTSAESQADIIKIPSPLPRSVFTMDGVTYTLQLTFGRVMASNSGFSQRRLFSVYEGESASVELLGKITACVDPLASISDLYGRAKSGKIDIVWTPMEEAVSYKVYRSMSQGGPYELIADTHVTNYAMYADFGLANDVTYYYVVRWVDARGQESPDSNEASATPVSGSTRGTR